MTMAAASFRFSRSPHKEKTFPSKKLFGTSHGLDLSRVASLFDFHYELVRSPTELEDALGEGKSRQGISLIHARLDRRENEARFRALVSEIVDAVDG